ncbi:transposable element Tc1 transposase [Trichonephila clavipes]|nr:transposable element Tc1 transposase [Trichonephila clavipes]
MPLRRNRRQYEQLTDFDRGRIIGLREAGWSNRRIGRHLGRSDMVVARCWQQWITEGRVYRRGGSGRPRNTNDREDRAIRRVATSAPTTSLASIQRHLPPSRHPVPSRETIRRRLTEVGLRSRRPLRRLPLTPHHRQCRLDFCRPRATWSVTDWRRVIFSDESRFSLSADDHRTRVWRRTGQRSDSAFIVERHTAISQGVTVWGAISWDTRSSLVVLQSTLTARRYVDDILTPIVLPMLSSRPGAIYQQDNARPHTARLSQQCLQGCDVLLWPARSPGLSPIEHTYLSLLRDYVFHLDLKSGDVVYNDCPPGWSVWDYELPTLSLGITQFLYMGSPVYKKDDFNIWKILSKYKITYAFISTTYFDGLHIENVLCEPGLKFHHLKLLTMGASPAKKRNYEFIYENLRTKDVFLGSQYGKKNKNTKYS